MRGRWPLWVLAASCPVFLASLYLPWRVGARVCHQGPHGGLDCFLANHATGWSSGVGDAAAVIGLALAAAAAAVLLRPGLAARLPLGAGGLLTAYLALAIGALLREQGGADVAYGQHVHFHWTYGAYLGVASGGVAAGAAAAFRGREPPRRPSLPAAAGGAFGLGLLVSFLLPWYRIAAGNVVLTGLGIGLPSTVVAAAIVVLAATRENARPALWAAAAVFALGSFSVHEAGEPRAYGAWLGLGIAVALLGAAALALRDRPATARRPAVGDLLPVGAAALFVASLFMPWQRLCLPAGSGGFGPHVGRCLAANGWTLPGSAAAILAFALVASVLLAWPARARAEPAVALGLLAASAGFQLGEPVLATRFAYGAYVGFASAGVLLLASCAELHVPGLDRGRLVARGVPVAASLACVAAVAVAWWSVLPSTWQPEATVLNAWLAAVGLLLALHLLWSWLRSAGRAAGGTGTLVLVPLALLALVALALVDERDLGLTWGGGILVALCLLLAVLGWIEENRGGLERLALPEILRLDRLPEVEG